MSVVFGLIIITFYKLFKKKTKAFKKLSILVFLPQL